jgi:hypothetical protein
VTHYQVTAPYVTCPSPSASAAQAALYPQLVGWTAASEERPSDIDPIAQFGFGAILPDDVPPAAITHLLAQHLIVAVP